MAELSDFEHERLLRLWLVAVANGAEDDDAVRAARELLACNQHGHWSGNHLPLRGGAPTYRAVLARGDSAKTNVALQLSTHRPRRRLGIS